LFTLEPDRADYQRNGRPAMAVVRLAASAYTPGTGVAAVNVSLKDVFAQLLLNDAGWVAVVDGGRCCGVLTVETLHAAVCRSAR